MPRYIDLREPLGTILQEHSDCYWLCYQTLNRLRERFPEILRALESKHGVGYGKNGGAHYRPSSAIAACLQDWPEHINIQYLYGRELCVDSTQVSGIRMGIYRWID